MKFEQTFHTGQPQFFAYEILFFCKNNTIGDPDSQRGSFLSRFCKGDRTKKPLTGLLPPGALAKEISQGKRGHIISLAVTTEYSKKWRRRHRRALKSKSKDMGACEPLAKCRNMTDHATCLPYHKAYNTMASCQEPTAFSRMRALIITRIA